MGPQKLAILLDHDKDELNSTLTLDSLKDIVDDDQDFHEVFSNGNVRADLRLGQRAKGELSILSKRNGWVCVACNTESISRELLVQNWDDCVPRRVAIELAVYGLVN